MDPSDVGVLALFRYVAAGRPGIIDRVDADPDSGALKGHEGAVRALHAMRFCRKGALVSFLIGTILLIVGGPIAASPLSPGLVAILPWLFSWGAGSIFLLAFYAIVAVKRTELRRLDGYFRLLDGSRRARDRETV